MTNRAIRLPQSLTEILCLRHGMTIGSIGVVQGILTVPL